MAIPRRLQLSVSTLVFQEVLIGPRPPRSLQMLQRLRRSLARKYPSPP